MVAGGVQVVVGVEMGAGWVRMWRAGGASNRANIH